MRIKSPLYLYHNFPTIFAPNYPKTMTPLKRKSEKEKVKKKKKNRLSNTFGMCWKQYLPLGKLKIYSVHKRL